jgi:hypothetical protein
MRGRQLNNNVRSQTFAALFAAGLARQAPAKSS